MRFVDTNVLLYAASLLPENAGKRSLALELLAEPDLAVSVQVLQEFYYQATRAGRPDRLLHDEAMQFIEPVLTMHVQPVTLDVFRAGIAISRRFGLFVLGRGDTGCGARSRMRRGVLGRPQHGAGL